MHPEIIEKTLSGIKELGGEVCYNEDTGLLDVNGEITASIVISRCFQTQGGRKRWKLRLDSGRRADITIVVRMDGNNEDILDYYLLPAIDIEHPQFRMADNNGFSLDIYRYDCLEAFFTLAERTEIKRVA